MIEESAMGGGPARAPGAASTATLLCLLLLVIYNANFRLGPSGDTLPARFLPFSLVCDHTLYLDDWVRPYLRGAYEDGGHFLTAARGHWMSSYPIITPVLVSPLYIAPAWWLRSQPAAAREEAARLIARTMEKLSASLLAALSAGVLYLALLRITTSGAALLVTLVYALAANTWSTSSQALWLHALTQLSFAFLIWALLRCSASGRRDAGGTSAFCAGLALAVAAANKPTNLLVALFVIAYVLQRHGNRLAAFFVPLLTVGALVLAYNLYFFGGILGAWSAAKLASGAWGGFGNPSPLALPGLLISPNRGLLAYSPWTVFAIWGAVRLWRENRWDWVRYLIPGVAALVLLPACYDRWWGGYCFGPRYLADVLPFCALFLAGLWPHIRRSRGALGFFIATVVFSLWVQCVGAFCYTWQWDNRPASVDAHPERLWDWRDSQVLRSWREGRAYPDLYYDWVDYLNARR